jgi:hypothetical protein
MQAGMKKSDYWDPTFEDMLNCIARLPRIAALIYRNVFRNGDITKQVYCGNVLICCAWFCHELHGTTAMISRPFLNLPHIDERCSFMPVHPRLTFCLQENSSDMAENFVRMLGVIACSAVGHFASITLFKILWILAQHCRFCRFD